MAQHSSAAPRSLVLPYGDSSPEVAADAFVADGVTLVGDVAVRSGASVWFGAILRADNAHIEVGARTNVQDGCVLHADPGLPVLLGADVSIGHRAVVHGCVVERDSLVGMGAVVLNGAVVGAGSLVAAGSVVLEGTEIPPGSLVAGVPGKVKREVTDAERERMADGVARYVARASRYLAGAASS